MHVDFHPAAEQELYSAAAFYERTQEGLGQGLLDEVEDVCAIVSEFAAIGRRVDSMHRSIPLCRFPFVLFYRVRESLVTGSSFRRCAQAQTSGVLAFAQVTANKQLQRTVRDKVPSHLGKRAAAELRR